jgi:hypothetical protein
VSVDIDDGTYFIDRNGRTFEYVLDWLRDGSLSSDISCDVHLLNKLLTESKFFGLSKLAKELESLQSIIASSTNATATGVNVNGTAERMQQQLVDACKIGRNWLDTGGLLVNDTTVSKISGGLEAVVAQLRGDLLLGGASQWKVWSMSSHNDDPDAMHSSAKLLPLDVCHALVAILSLQYHMLGVYYEMASGLITFRWTICKPSSASTLQIVK